MNRGSKAPFLAHLFHTVRLYLLRVPVAQHNATRSHYTWQALSFVQPGVVHSHLHWNQTAPKFSRKKAAGKGWMFFQKLFVHPSISLRDRVALPSALEGVAGSLLNNNASSILFRDCSQTATNSTDMQWNLSSQIKHIPHFGHNQEQISTGLCWTNPVP